jgi:hypothetical protein
MIRAVMIVEMAGKPAAHVKETLAKHVGVMEKINDVSVVSINISEPKEIEHIPEGFTCFAEVEFETESFGRLTELTFDFMPSSIEILEPSKINFDSKEATALLNNIAGRMHRYDEAVRMTNGKAAQLATQLEAAQKALEEKGKKPTKKKAKKKKAKK